MQVLLQDGVYFIHERWIPLLNLGTEQFCGHHLVVWRNSGEPVTGSWAAKAHWCISEEKLVVWSNRLDTVAQIAENGSDRKVSECVCVCVYVYDIPYYLCFNHNDFGIKMRMLS